VPLRPDHPGRDGKVIDYDSWRRTKWEPVVGRQVWFAATGKDRDRTFRSEGEARKHHGGDVELRSRWEPGLAGIGQVTIHDLRHTYASWLLQERVTLAALCDLLGHASLQTTMRYAHLADTQWDSVRGALDAKSAPKTAPR
jgi:integrase